jgi:hypothetical protein
MMKLNVSFLETDREKGAIALATMMVLSLVITIISLSIGGMAILRTTTSQTGSESTESFYLSESGNQDALLKIARDKTTTKGLGEVGINSYLEVGIENTGGGNQEKTISSNSSLKNQYNSLRLIIGLDDNGKITSYNWGKTTE